MSILINDGNIAGDKVVKCDIGEFVLCYVKLKRYMSPAIKLYSYVIAVLKWDRPIHTLFWLIFTVWITMYNPVYLLISCMLPIPPLLVMELIRGCGKRKPPEKKYVDCFHERGEVYEQQLKQAEQERWKEHLRLYIDILITLQQHFVDVSSYLTCIKRVMSWERPVVSMICLLVSLSLELMLYLMEFRMVLAMSIIALFVLNPYFFCTVQSTLLKMANQTRSLFLSREEFPIKHVEATTNAEEEIANNDKQIDDEVHSDPFYYHSSNTDESDEENEDVIDSKKIVQPTRKYREGSSLSKFIPRSLRRRYMKTGNCTNCDRPSSILTKRRYCRQCGHSFCSRCCHTSLPRALLGATAPAAYQEKVLVCVKCHIFLTSRSKTEL